MLPIVSTTFSASLTNRFPTKFTTIGNDHWWLTMINLPLSLPPYNHHLTAILPPFKPSCKRQFPTMYPSLPGKLRALRSSRRVSARTPGAGAPKAAAACGPRAGGPKGCAVDLSLCAAGSCWGMVDEWLSGEEMVQWWWFRRGYWWLEVDGEVTANSQYWRG